MQPLQAIKNNDILPLHEAFLFAVIYCDEIDKKITDLKQEIDDLKKLFSNQRSMLEKYPFPKL